VLIMTGHRLPLPALASPAAHAHEMLLGFALAVVAGNQLGLASAQRVVGLLALWAAARAAFLVLPASLLSVALNSAFAGLLALQVAPRLFGSAKKLRNQALPAILAGLCIAAVSWELSYRSGSGAPTRAVVLLFALLMLFMGGRIIAPTVAGQLHRQGRPLDARVQPRLEGALLLAGAIALLGLAVPSSPSFSGMGAAAAGVLAAVRLVRWKLWSLRGRPDLLCLACGYAWLSAGLVAFGAALLSGRLESAAIHLITVGALGTLTFNVMALSWKLKARRSPEEGSVAIVLGTSLLGAAAAARVAGAFDPTPWLLVAAACWAGAYVVLLGIFWHARLRA
jgi:uncharacterized protein involved in response to NO